MNLKNYKLNLKKLIDEIDLSFIENIVEKMKKVKKRNGKILIIGNGGSISTANHISVDLTKNAKIPTLQPYNDNLITCYSNDYGFENWVYKLIKYFLNKKDLVILLSVSGNSKNLVKAAKLCSKSKIDLISLTGFNKKNKLSKIGNFNYSVNSKSYNQVEAMHFIILSMVVDKLVGKDIYGTNL
jgi:D-sedoheptulose 7-phosphate isomerase